MPTYARVNAFNLRLIHLLWMMFFLCGAQAMAQRSERACPAGNYAALGYPTLPSKSIAPKPGDVVLRNPLIHDETKDLLIIAVGDSVMWGNGLDIPDKFIYLAAQMIATKTQRTVELRSYAHSGAVLDATFGESVAGNAPSYIPAPIAKGVKKGYKRVANGDLNSALPTIFQEEDCARGQDGARAEIVLMDGCINNVGAENIAMPFSSRNPSKLNSLAATGVAAGENCAKLYDLAETAKVDFPHATIILTNYYTVVTQKSSLLEGFNLYKSGRVLSVMAKGVNGMLHVVGIPALFRHTKWQENSEQFLTNSNRCIGWAVMHSNGWPVAVLTADEKKSCPSSVELKDVEIMQRKNPANQAARVFVAENPDKLEFGFGIPSTTHLWGLPQEHTFLGLGKGHQDEVYERRKELCQAFYAKYFGQLECRLSPLAHPRQIGAEAYATAIAGGPATTDSVMDAAWAMPKP